MPQLEVQATLTTTLKGIVNMTNLKFPSSAYKPLWRNFPNPGSRKFAYATTMETMADTNGNLVFGIYHHNSLIAVIGENEVSVSAAGWASRTAADRIDRILWDNATGSRGVNRKGEAQFINFSSGELTDMPYNEFVTYPTNKAMNLIA
ncbi:gp91 [Corynebacterium phage P1201]|uniref:Gp91 n=1 Tax=Corynebacterium phage P1201 TaxID=384848 RepID=A7IYF8_9CAUD|nr:gp91 [Corynebacterium phage P1201]ABF57541.1 gp91 [Corynebacterium phage P1201]